MEDHGFISLGKFSSARDSILEYLCNNGWSNEDFGNVEAPTGYVYRISNTLAEVQMENSEVTSLLGDWFEGNSEVTDSPELREELIGHFIVTEDNQGFVRVAKFDTEKEMLAEFQRLEDAYNEWDTDEDENPHTGHYSTFGTYWCDTCNSPYCDRA